MKKLHLVLTWALALGLLVGLTTSTAISVAYPGKKIQIPSINVENGWSTLIHAQNVGDDDTGAIVFFWGEYSGLCPPNSPGPAAVVCRAIVQHGVWTLRSEIPTEAKAAIIYSVDKDAFGEACQDGIDAIGDDYAWGQWKAAYQGTGQPLAVVVLRFGPNNSYDDYDGISEAVEGECPCEYYALYLVKEYQGENAQLSIQNSGEYCVFVVIEYRESGTGQLTHIQHFEALAPGEALHLKMEDGRNRGDTHQLAGDGVRQGGSTPGSCRGTLQRLATPHQHGNTDPDRNFDQHADSHTDPDFHSDSHANRDTHSHSHPNLYSDCYANRDTHSNADPNRHVNADQHLDTDFDQHPNGDSNWHRHSHIYSNRYAYGD